MKSDNIQEKKYLKCPEKTRFTLNTLESGQRMTIFGMTRTGKTYFAEKLLKNKGKEQLVVVLDVKDEYDLPTLPLSKIRNKNSKGVYRINSILYQGHKVNDLYYICEFLSKNLFKRENCWLVIDEIAKVIPKTGMIYKVAPYFGTYLCQGALHKCGLIAISQRPAQVHTDIPSESDHIVCFYVHGERDLLAIKNWIPIHWFQNLKQYEFLRFTVPRTLEIHRRMYSTKKKGV